MLSYFGLIFIQNSPIFLQFHYEILRKPCPLQQVCRVWVFISELQKPLNLQLSLNWQTRKQIRGPQKVAMREEEHKQKAKAKATALQVSFNFPLHMQCLAMIAILILVFVQRLLRDNASG
ncbi:unnamed protein product [Malus baccata var. baccata]